MRARGPSTRRAYPSGIVPWTAWHVVQLSRRSLQRVRAYRLRIQSAEFDVQGHVRRDRRCSHSAGNGRGARRGSTAARSSRGRADPYARRRLPHKARRLRLRARTRIVRIHTQRYAAHVAEHREPASAVLRDDHAGRNGVRGVLPALRGVTCRPAGGASVCAAPHRNQGLRGARTASRGIRSRPELTAATLGSGAIE